MQNIEDLDVCENRSSTCTASCNACPRASLSSSTDSSPSSSPANNNSSSWTPPPPPPPPPTEIYDIIIIGAGAVGCSIARELSRYTSRTLVLERSDDVAQGASKANSGIVHGGYDEHHGTLKSKVARPGNEMYDQLEKELHFGFRRVGALVLAYSEKEVAILEQLVSNGEKNGVKGLVIIGKAEVRKKEPHIHPDVYAALFCPGTGITSPYEYTIALAENAMTNGVHIRLSHEVVDIQRAHGQEGFVVKTDRGKTFRATYIINAAGLFSDKVAAMVGANNFSIEPRKGLCLPGERCDLKTTNFLIPSIQANI